MKMKFFILLAILLFANGCIFEDDTPGLTLTVGLDMNGQLSAGGTSFDGDSAYFYITVVGGDPETPADVLVSGSTVLSGDLGSCDISIPENVSDGQDVEIHVVIDYDTSVSGILTEGDEYLGFDGTPYTYTVDRSVSSDSVSLVDGVNVSFWGNY